MTRAILVFLLIGLVCHEATGQSVKVPWLAFNGGGTRPGINYNETTISAQNVDQLALRWKQAIPDTVDSAAVLFPDVTLADGATADLLVLNGRKAGVLMALNAGNGSLVWQNVITPSSGGGCGIGQYTKSTPVIDPSGLFVYDYRLDGAVHKYHLANGTEAAAGLGFPAVGTLVPKLEQGSSSLNLINGVLYMTISGYNGDCGHYVGHVVSVELSTGRTGVWNSLCSDLRHLLTSDKTAPNYCPEKESGIWARSGAVEEPLDGTVYVATGNGEFDGTTMWGDTLVKLAAGLPDDSQQQVMVDTYTPEDYEAMDKFDEDLGSTAPCLLPPQPSSKTPHMLLQASKDQVVRLIDRTNLSGRGCCGNVGGQVYNISFPPGGYVLTAPVAWQDPSSGLTLIFVAGLKGFVCFSLQTDAAGASSLAVEYQLPVEGTSPFLANGVLYLQTSNLMLALDPPTGKTLWQFSGSGSLHMQSPIVVNGDLYSLDNSGNAYAFGIPPLV